MQLFSLVFVTLVIFLLIKFFKKLLFFVLNSVVGLLALFGFNQLFGASIPINLWSILITGIGGVFGFFVVLILHLVV